MSYETEYEKQCRLVQYFTHENHVAPCEQSIERKWKVEKGVDPETGEAWLTPRMERNAIRTAAMLKLDDAGMRKIIGGKS